MKPCLQCVVLGIVLLAGCVGGPAVSKARDGNMEINLTTAGDANLRLARVFVDEVFIGNISPTLPVLHLKNGRRTVRVELEGFKTWQQTVHVLGEPNHQVLNVVLEKQ